MEETQDLFFLVYLWQWEMLIGLFGKRQSARELGCLTLQAP